MSQLVSRHIARIHQSACRLAGTNTRRSEASAGPTSQQAVCQCQLCKPHEMTDDYENYLNIGSAILTRPSIGRAHNQSQDVQNLVGPSPGKAK